jgi:hypothetical protein
VPADPVMSDLTRRISVSPPDDKPDDIL